MGENLKRGVVRHWISAGLVLLLLAGGTKAIENAAGAPGAPSSPSLASAALSAKDLPLNRNGATGALDDWLKPFDRKPETFSYTLRPADEDDDVITYRLAFPSPFRSAFAENNVVPAEYFVPKIAAGKVPAAVVLDIMLGNGVVARGMARGLASQGVAALYVPMAYYGPRRPHGEAARQRLMSDDPARSVEAARQTVMDIRRAKAILASRPEIDPHHLSITGVSLGGIMTALAAGVDGEFDRVVPILGGGDIAAITFHAPETVRVRARLQERGITQEKLEPLLAPIEPCNFAGRIDAGKCLMINAERDEVIPRATTEALWQAIGKPKLLWAPAGHYTAIAFLPTIRQTAIDFIKGKQVEALEY